MCSRFDKNTKIVRLEGGLGNQMFQYAFGVALAQKTGCKVLFDKILFDIYYSQTFHRGYSLNIFNIDIPFCSAKESKRFNKLKKEVYSEKIYYEFNDEVFKTDKRLFEGYWQNEKYFYNVASKIRKDFKFPILTDDFNKEVLSRIKKCKNSVAIHVRRGDYLKTLGWVLPMNYYRKAAKYIASKVTNPKFFVFTNEPDDNFRKEFDLGFDYELVDNVNEKNDEDWKDLCLMEACKHKIIANSTFSWWAAWLSDFDENDNLKTDQIVCAPSPFLYGSMEFIPDRWHKIIWIENYTDWCNHLARSYNNWNASFFEIKYALDDVLNSRSYKMGRFVTFPLRKIRNIFNSIRKHN